MTTVHKQPTEPDLPEEPGRDDDPALQGEGNYSAARRHRKSVEEFVEDTDVEQAARDAAPRSEQQAQEMRDAEEAGRSRAR